MEMFLPMSIWGFSQMNSLYLCISIFFHFVFISAHCPKSTSLMTWIHESVLDSDGIKSSLKCVCMSIQNLHRKRCLFISVKIYQTRLWSKMLFLSIQSYHSFQLNND